MPCDDKIQDVSLLEVFTPWVLFLVHHHLEISNCKPRVICMVTVVMTITQLRKFTAR